MPIGSIPRFLSDISDVISPFVSEFVFQFTENLVQSSSNKLGLHSFVVFQYPIKFGIPPISAMSFGVNRGLVVSLADIVEAQ